MRSKYLKVGRLQVAEPLNLNAAEPPPLLPLSRLRTAADAPEAPAKRQRGGGGKARAPPPVVQPPEETSTALTSLDVQRLCGRLLAASLLKGDGYFVDDRLPLYVLEYLATDNVFSLETTDGALEQLETVEPAHADLLRRYALLATMPMSSPSHHPVSRAESLAFCMLLTCYAEMATCWCMRQVSR